MALVIALAKRNAFTVEAYARLFVKSGLRILELGVVEGDAQKRVLAVQMLNFLIKYQNPKSMSSEVELVLQEMRKHVDDEVYFVRVAVHETLGTAERLIREADGENCKIQFSDGEGDNMDSVCFHQRNRSSEFDESVCSMSNHSRRSRRNRKKRRTEALSLGHLVAKNEDECVQLSVDLASDITALSKLRMSLRDLMAGSPVCNGPSFAVALESAYRSMWRKYCKGEVPSLKRMEMLQRKVQEDPSISKELGSSRLNVTGEATPSLKANGSAPVPSSLPTQSSQLSKRMDSTS
ncbi:hypothetical protein F2Q69_00031916 [Brassica cretica]|uniref:Uncharacterized protein n=1 Tax=Brassica cretica TaxID=69181 RepID=A0A8S9S3V1_BRACR|nr:hypothetical protein F2Q69_00031916 [Brassica cretica]